VKASGCESERSGVSIAVVIPTLNEATRIDACLAAVRRQMPGGGAADVVVVDGGSIDGTPRLAASRARVTNAPRGRGVQLNAGARMTSDDVLLFLHADTTLPAGAFAAIDSALVDPEIVGGTFRLRFDHDAVALRLYAWCTRFRWRLLHYGDQGIFVRRATFEALGGFREWPIMEDVDFLARLDAAGRTVLLPLAVITSARRFARHGVVRQQLLNTALMAGYLAGVAPTRLARWYENVHR